MATDANQPDDNFQTNNPSLTPQQQRLQDQQLPEDNDTPFSPPSGVQDRIDDTHPTIDQGMDEHERYDAGIEASAAGERPGQAADEKPTEPPVV